MKHWSKLLSTVIAMLILLLMTQCQKPLHILGRDKMRAITKEMLLTEVYLQSQPQIEDSVATLYYESVLEKYGVSRAEYDSALIWYGENAHRMVDLYNEINIELTATKSELDTFLTDSIYRERLRYEPVNTLWGRQQRIYLPANQTIWIHEQTLSPEEPFQASDTLIWSTTIWPQLTDGLETALQLVILNNNGLLFQKVRAASGESVQNTITHTLILPDSLPPTPRYTLFLTLSKPTKSILLDQIQLYKKEPMPIDTEELAEDTDSLGQETTSPALE